MIATLEGIVSESTPTNVILDVQGVGYEVHIPVTTAEKLPGNGKKTKLHIRAIYREDTQQLFGFHSRQLKDLFNVVIDKVSGVGPKSALGILSHHTADSLRTAIATEDVKMLTKCPGIGKKTAERIIVELKDFMGAALFTAPPSGSVSVPASGSPASEASGSQHNLQDAVAALMALGYKAPEAEKSVLRVLKTMGEDASVEELVKGALQK
jgi:Holliday junction DNA helicase RuvA